MKAWRAHVKAFIDHLGHADAARVSAEDVVAWKDKLLAQEIEPGRRRNPGTVRNGHIAALKALFRWARENKKIAADPSEGLRVRGAKQPTLRDKGLTQAEAEMILKASLQPVAANLAPGHALARRWVPWLLAYTGARVNELTQLRAEDVSQVEGIWTIRITPEAGAVKNRKARIVPLHSHLIEQGFVRAMEGRKGPLFYDPDQHRGGSDGNPQFKKLGERLAAWVREVGVVDESVAPNHGWRHRFKSQARLSSMASGAADAIQGTLRERKGKDTEATN